MINEVYIIDDDETSVVVFRELFREDPEYKFISVKTENIDIALKNIPSLIVINEDAINSIYYEPENNIYPTVNILISNKLLSVSWYVQYIIKNESPFTVEYVEF